MKNIRLIDAIALKETINAFYDALFVGCVSSDLITFAQGVDVMIDDAPTISERSQGEWKKSIYGFYTCSKCGNYGNPEFFNYCSGCGADMRGDENNGK